MKVLSLFILISCSGCLLNAQTLDSVDRRRIGTGLVFEAGCGLNSSASSSSARALSTFFMGAGYHVSPRVALWLRVYTGAAEVQHGVTRPVSGRLSLGGGGVEAAYFLNGSGAWRPFVAVGYELVTLLDESGYNGGGPRAAAGVQLNLSRFFAVNLEGQYSRRRFYNLVRFEGDASHFRPFVEHVIGGTMSFSFYPNILP